MFFFLFVSVLAGTALAANSSNLVRCGNENPPDAFFEVAKQIVRESAAVAGRTIEVDTFFHIVTSEENEGIITDQMLSDQLDVLNRDYEPNGISFNLIDTDYTMNDDWATGLLFEEMMLGLRQGTYADLNIYFLSDLANSVLGYCQLPGPFPYDDLAYYTDGCIVHAGSVPGGYYENYNQGGSATHEVGHWFGLLHVFEGETCDGDGDSVYDTPQQKTATQGCPETQDSCPGISGEDSIHNYMDYAYDECYTEFTPGQAARMFLMWDKYRAGK